METPLGRIWFETDQSHIYRLWFACPSADGITGPLQGLIKSTEIGGDLKRQMAEYFAGKRQCFELETAAVGSEFQHLAWATLLTIPYAQTISYADQAAAMKRPTAIRAAANANGANPLPILVPCHRVIASGGGLGGYGPGVDKKAWLLEHEKRYGSFVA